jgi:hypothetical protein
MKKPEKGCENPVSGIIKYCVLKKEFLYSARDVEG